MFRNRPEFACALEALTRRDFARAFDELSALLAHDGWTAPERAFLLNKRGVAEIGLGRPEPAHADFLEALEMQNGYAPALTNLGNLLLESGRLEEAIAQYERAVASDGEYAVAYLNLGVAYKRAGRIGEGVQALRTAQRLEQRASAPRFFRRPRER